MLKLLAIAATLSSQAASIPPVPAPTPCLTRQQVGDLAVVSIAISVEVTRNACRPHLAGTAWLATPAAAEFSARLRTEARQRFDSAMAGISRMMAGTPEMAQVTAMMQGMAGMMMTEGAGADFSGIVDAELCRDASEILEISSTLSPDQMARLTGAFASIADHIIRTGPPRPPRSHGPGTPPMMVPAPTPPATAPAPTPTPAAFEYQRRARRPATPPAVTAPPTPPMQPFLCRPGE